MKFTLCALLFGLPLLAQLSVPKVGTARYQDGSLHSVQGLSANMIVAPLPLDSAEAASFSDSGGIVSQNGTIRLLAPDFTVVAEYPAHEKLVVSIDGALTSALAWLPNSHTLLHWNGSAFDAIGIAESDIEGTVTGLQLSGTQQARLIVQHADGSVSAVTISLHGGNLVSSELLSGVRGYAFGQGSYVVSVSNQELVVDNLQGYRRSVAFAPQDLVIERMSNNWLHLYSPAAHRNWALHVTQAELELSLLPGVRGTN